MHPGQRDRIEGGRGNDTILAVDGKKDVIDCGRGKFDRVEYELHFDVLAANCETKTAIGQTRAQGV